tara:strand:+ start:272 stop:460 length:189 start_codon:yes stop_codon:yes gene_type:complete
MRTTYCLPSLLSTARGREEGRQAIIEVERRRAGSRHYGNREEEGRQWTLLEVERARAGTCIP